MFENQPGDNEVLRSQNLHSVKADVCKEGSKISVGYMHRPRAPEGDIWVTWRESFMYEIG